MSHAPTAADTIVDFLSGVRDNAPADVRHAAKRIILNGLRASLPASSEELPGRLAAGEAERLGNAGGDGGLLWSDRRLPVEEASAINLLSWTLLLLDDLDEVSGIHPGGPTCGAALPLAASLKSSGADLLSAVIAGVELQNVVARAASPELLQRGFAPLSVIAPLGSVAAATVLRALPAEAARNAVGIAAMSGFGVWEMGGTGSALFLSGQATRLGMAAARATLLGVDGPPRAIDGDFGAFRAYSGKSGDVLAAALAQLGEQWTTTSVVFQPFSGDTYSQAPLQALRLVHDSLDAEGQGKPVESIVVEVSERIAIGVRRKYARHPRIETALTLNSDPQSRVAAAWLRSQYSYSPEFENLVHDEQVAALRERVEFRSTPRYPDMTGATVEVKFADGSSEKAEVEAFTGSARGELSDELLSEWFRASAAGRLSEQRTEQILDRVWHLDEADSVAPLAEVIFAGPDA